MGLERRAGGFLTRRELGRIVLGTGLSLGAVAAGIVLQGDTVSPEQQLAHDVENFEHNIKNPGSRLSTILMFDGEVIVDPDGGTKLPEYSSKSYPDRDDALKIENPLIFPSIKPGTNNTAYLHVAYFLAGTQRLAFTPLVTWFSPFQYNSPEEFNQSLIKNKVEPVTVRAYEPKSNRDYNSPLIMVSRNWSEKNEPFEAGQMSVVHPKGDKTFQS